MNISALQLFIAAISGIAAAYIAKRNQKNPYIWCLVGFFFGLIGLFFLYFLPKLRKHTEKEKLGPMFRGPKDKQWFYLDPTHNQIGPVSANAILEALHNGNLSTDSYVWHEDLTDWKRVKEFIY